MKKIVAALMIGMVLLTGCNSVPNNESTANATGDIFAMEVDLGDKGQLRFDVPNEFHNKLEVKIAENGVDKDSYSQSVELWVIDPASTEQIFTIAVLEQAVYDQYVADGIPLPTEINKTDGFIIGYYPTQYNQFDEGTESYKLVADHYSDLTQSIIDTLVWSRESKADGQK